MSAFLNYALSLGQQKAPSIGYASLGQPLEEFGISEAQNDIPGADALASAEQAAVACGSLTPAEAVAGDTAPVCSTTPMEIVTSSLPGATVGQPYSTRLTAIGGIPPTPGSWSRGRGTYRRESGSTTQPGSSPVRRNKSGLSTSSSGSVTQRPLVSHTLGTLSRSRCRSP